MVGLGKILAAIAWLAPIALAAPSVAPSISTTIPAERSIITSPLDPPRREAVCVSCHEALDMWRLYSDGKAKDHKEAKKEAKRARKDWRKCVSHRNFDVLKGHEGKAAVDEWTQRCKTAEKEMRRLEDKVDQAQREYDYADTHWEEAIAMCVGRHKLIQNHLVPYDGPLEPHGIAKSQECGW